MTIGTTITLGLGSSGAGNLDGNIPKLLLTGLTTPAAAAAARGDGGSWLVVVGNSKGSKILR